MVQQSELRLKTLDEITTKKSSPSKHTQMDLHQKLTNTHKRRGSQVVLEALPTILETSQGISRQPTMVAMKNMSTGKFRSKSIIPSYMTPSQIKIKQIKRLNFNQENDYSESIKEKNHKTFGLNTLQGFSSNFNTPTLKTKINTSTLQSDCQNSQRSLTSIEFGESP